MSVPEYQRGEGKFTVLMEARFLANYTLQICSNKKVFTEKYQEVMADDLIGTAKNIFIDAFTANEIKVESDEEAKERLSLIKKSILNCDRLLALMQMSKSLYHLDSKRIKYWGGKTLSVKNLLKKWYQSECKRYKSVADKD